MIKDSGERTEFGTGAVRDMHAGKGRFDLLPWHAIHDVAKHCEEGALKYGERNVDKGIPQHSLIDSAMRHMVKYLHNETDEPHLRAAAWNILWALEQETTHRDLIDLPGRKQVASASTLFTKWIDDVDSWMCPACGHSVSNPLNLPDSGTHCPKCKALLDNRPLKERCTRIIKGLMPNKHTEA